MSLASRRGMREVSLNDVATETGLSKSGLFGHFRSKDDLHVQLLDHAAEKFRGIMAPAFAAPRGEARLRAVFDRWMTWAYDDELPGGCVFARASLELGDDTGRVARRLRRWQLEWLDSLARVTQTAIDEGSLAADVDPGQFARELYGIFLMHHFLRRTLRETTARRRTETAFERLLDRNRPRPRTRRVAKNARSVVF
jgi:AcrR family transcriptional regulator